MRDGQPDTSKAAIGERLAAVRAARGLIPAAMARALDLSSQRYGTYEGGRSVPPPEVLARFWQLTGATADYILFGRKDGLPLELAEMLRVGEAQQGKQTKAS